MTIVVFPHSSNTTSSEMNDIENNRQLIGKSFSTIGAKNKSIKFISKHGRGKKKHVENNLMGVARCCFWQIARYYFWSYPQVLFRNCLVALRYFDCSARVTKTSSCNYLLVSQAKINYHKI